MNHPDITLTADCKCSLGEGPLWALNRVIWFDINNSEMLSCDADGGNFHRVRLPLRPSAAVPASNGRLILATDGGLAECNPDGGDFRIFAPMEEDKPDNRSNDSKADPAGNFWVGTMSHSHIPESGAIYRCAPREKRRGHSPRFRAAFHAELHRLFAGRQNDVAHRHQKTSHPRLRH